MDGQKYIWDHHKYRVEVIASEKPYGLLYIGDKLIYYANEQIRFMTNGNENQQITDILCCIYHNMALYGLSVKDREYIAGGLSNATAEEISLPIQMDILEASEKSLLEADKMLYNEMQSLVENKIEEGQYLLF